MPVDRRTVLQNAQLYASKGQYDAAVAEWKKLTQDSPTDGSVYNSIGDLHVKRHANGEAITAYLQAAAAFRTEGSTLKAIAAYKKILKVDPNRYEVYRHLGDLNAERGLLSSAVQDYLTLGKYYLKEGKNKDALEIYRRIITQDPSNLDAQQQVAELCVQENLQDEAITGYLQLGRERSAQQRPEEARDAYLAVLRLDPSNAEAQEVIGTLEGASASVPPRKAAEGSPVKLTEPGDLLGEAMRRMEEAQYAGAEAMLAQLLSREPGNPQICQLMARLHLLQGNLTVALGEYRFLAGAALRAQDHLLAEALIREFLDADPTSVPMLELNGELLEEQGKKAEAAEQYGRAVELLIVTPEPGMPTLPAELYEKVLALAPTSAVAKRLAPHFPSMAAELARAPEAAESPASTNAGRPDQPAPDKPPAADSAPFRFLDGNSAPSAASPATPSAAERNGRGGAAEPMAPQTDHDASPDMGEPDDAETHYALGLSYRDMGLFDEAKEEFAASMDDEGWFVKASLMTALCIRDQRQPDQAVALLEHLVEDARCQNGHAQAVRYELARMYESVSAYDRAIALYQSIATFQDVPQRLDALRGGHTNGSAAGH